MTDLTRRDADILRYTLDDGLSPHSIASALGTTEQDIRTALRRAYRAISTRGRNLAAQLTNQPNPDTEAPVGRPRLFHLQRDHDVTGISGTGTVAHGVQWPDGAVTIRWAGDRPSTVQWTSVDDAIAVHGHGGHTRIVWADGSE